MTLGRAWWVVRGKPEHWTEGAEAVYDEDHTLMGVGPDGSFYVPKWRDWAWRYYPFHWWRPTHWPPWWRARFRNRYAWLDEG